MKTFKKVYIEITSVCNLACSFCPPTERAKGLIKPEQFSHILDEIRPHTKYIYLHVKGEPLLHPRLGQLLDIAHDKGFKVNITTNGTLINKQYEKIIDKPAIRQMNFSLHSFDGHEGSENREKYLGDILKFVGDERAKNIIFSFRLWNLQRDDQTEIDRRKNSETLDILEEHFDLPFKIEERVEPGKGVKIASNVYLNQDHEFRWPALSEPEYSGKGFCHALKTHSAILVDGSVVPCCLDGEGVINLGNVHEQKFSDIVESDRANAIVEGFSGVSTKLEICNRDHKGTPVGYRPRP